MADIRGQTMIELLTALFVLSLALVGGFSLMTTNVRNQHTGAVRLTASGLAREGVEVARSIRDSNWLASLGTAAWDTGLKDPTGTSPCAILAQDMRRFTFVACKEPIDPLYRISKNENGVYIQRGEATGDPLTGTQLYRVIRFQPICLVNGQETLDACGASQRIGVYGESRVSWKHGSQIHEVVAAQNLYNWR